MHIPSSPKKQAVGIYIGAEAIEIIQLRRKNKTPSIIKSIYKEIPKEASISETIKEIFQTEGIKETAVTTTIPEESVMLRRFSMPIIPVKERPIAIRFEAKRHIPFNLDEVISCFHIISEDRTKKQMEVLFIAVKKEEINSIVKILQQAGLTTDRIEPSSLAIIKSLSLSGNIAPTGVPTAIFHFVSKDRANIFIVENNIPYIKREITVVAKGDKIQEQIINEIRLSSNYYKREFPKKDITKLIISGAKQSFPWLPALQESLNIPVEQSSVLASMTGKATDAGQQEIAIGLAGRRIERPVIDINLLPRELAGIKYNIKKIAVMEVCLGAVFLALVYTTKIPGISRMKAKVVSAEKIKIACPELDMGVKSLTELKNLEEAWLRKKGIIQTFTKQRISWHEKLARVSGLIPQETWINHISYNDPAGISSSKNFTLKCTTYAEGSLREIEITNTFFQSLSNDAVFMKGFKKIELGTINKNNIGAHEVVGFDVKAE